MFDLSLYIIPFPAGLLIGAIFFGGLWWTIRKSVTSKWPAIWFLGSIPVRTIVSMVGFYIVARGDWRRLIVCLAGFLVARLIVTRLIRGQIEGRLQPREGGTS